MAGQRGPVLVIGDVVDSRTVDDQRRLLDGLSAAVALLRDASSAAATTGDEFQAVYDDLGLAIRSIAELRLRLLDDPPVDRPVHLRVGFGLGAVIGPEPVDAGAPGQSGPGWWHARAALDHVRTPRRAWSQLRWWVCADDDVDHDLAVHRGVLVALDALASRFDPIDVSLARGLLDGRTASDLARDRGLTRQSVSERLHDHGVYGWVRTLETLTEPPT
jgi:hypothetical protein